jgi:O-antigen ligase
MVAIKTIAQGLLALFPVIAIPGWDLNELWELMAIWAGVLGLSFVLTSWWRRAFLCLALLQVIMYKTGASYAALGAIALFLLAAEALKRVPMERVMACMRIAAVSQAALMAAQAAGLIPIYNSYGVVAGFMNPTSSGVFLAMCVPVFFIKIGEQRARSTRTSERRLSVPPWLTWLMGITVIVAVFASQSTTAIVTMTAALCAGWIAATWSGFYRKTAIGILAAGLIIAALGANYVDPLDRKAGDVRFKIWHRVLQTVSSAPEGRGLGSFQTIFPYWVMGRPDITESKVVAWVGGKPVHSTKWWWNYAHNEFLQVLFEMGVQGCLLLAAYVAWFGAWFVRRTRAGATDGEIVAGAGMVAVLVSCVGWFTFHEAPLALVGVAWIGMWERENRRTGETEKRRIWPILPFYRFI